MAFASLLTASCECGSWESYEGEEECTLGDYDVHQKSCVEILSCLLSCPENDDRCSDDCFRYQLPEAGDALVFFLACENACEDTECMVDQCSGELLTCIGSMVPEDRWLRSQVEATPPLNPAEDLAAAWAGGAGELAETFTFGTDGEVHHTVELNLEYRGCPIAASIVEEGEVVFGEEAFVMSIDHTTIGADVCGTWSSRVLPSTRAGFGWELDPSGALYVTNLYSCPEQELQRDEGRCGCATPLSREP